MAARLTIALLLLWTTAAAAQTTPMDDPGAAPPSTSAEEPAPAPTLPTQAVPAPPAAESKADDISLEEWNRNDWMLVKPKVSLVDIDGYLRIRGDTMQRLDFGNGASWEMNPSTNAYPSPYRRYSNYQDGSANYTQTNMRLRIEPRINITEQIQIISTVDIFDNVIMGSTPNTIYPGVGVNGRTPTNIMATYQESPRRGINSVTDNIVVKRLWGRVTALNDQLELRVGRVPDQWGIGMLYNPGDCLDCDWGTNVDRLAVSFRAVNHVFMPMVDWISKGPAHKAFGYWDAMPVDALSWDDAMQYGIRIFREDSREDVHDALLHNKTVVNYGMSNVVRLQARDLPGDYYTGDPTVDPNNLTNTNPGGSPGYGERRNAFIYQGDAYAKVYLPHIEIKAEAAVTAGNFEDTLTSTTGGRQLLTTSITQVGAALEGHYHARADRRGLHLSLKTGGASGDSRQGMGALDLSDTQRGPTPFGYDTALRNFQFSPNYIVDYILFRRIIGTVTDAWYLKPEVEYHFDEKVLGKLSAIYSQAMFDLSTASLINKPLGLEFDGEVAYGDETQLERGQLIAALRGGLVFPLSGFNNPDAGNGQNAGGSFAWAVQARLYLTF